MSTLSLISVETAMRSHYGIQYKEFPPQLVKKMNILKRFSKFKLSFYVSLATIKTFWLTELHLSFFLTIQPYIKYIYGQYYCASWELYLKSFPWHLQ